MRGGGGRGRAGPGEPRPGRAEASPCAGPAAQPLRGAGRASIPTPGRRPRGAEGAAPARTREPVGEVDGAVLGSPPFPGPWDRAALRMRAGLD